MCMRHILNKWSKKLAISGGIAIIGVLLVSLVALAVPGLVTSFTPIAITSTSVSMTWVKAPLSVNTVIRYDTTGYPATEVAGFSAYSLGTASYATKTGLTPSTTYYFSAFGEDGGGLYGAATHMQATTLSPWSNNATIPYPTPTLPPEAYQDPDISGWSAHIYPFNVILDWFSDNTSAHGGLGMQTNNLVMFMVGMGVSFVGIVSYVKWRTFLSSWTIVFILSFFFVGIHIMQGWVIVVEIITAAGYWAVEHNFQ